MRTTLDALNAASPEAFAGFAGDLFAGAAWVGERAARARPFPTVAALHAALLAAASDASPEERRDLVRGFPDLAAELAEDGFDRLPAAEAETLARFSAAYRARFGFPFVLCTRRRTREAILDSLEARLSGDTETELAAALAEIGHITRLRLVDRVEGPGPPPTTGRLSTHILDTHGGRPAAGVALRLYVVGRGGRRLLDSRTTNADGRTDTPLLAGTPLRAGRYEIEFDIGPYFRGQVDPAVRNLFLETVPVRFGIDEPEGHYHVAMIATPWSYTVYRGS
ncbi:2-oxo-4-hydroxy-4-carboxy-5-ureidoimidazoline decarboxylase [Methylobacterium nodulans]|uniref:Hydroxyisourate hydrolase n=1 Tax=Methylobacterium nodulans (strain LMG 21967 / CNCM I-2342 / ORS 2060) TaxID=460265 RepID=B8IRU2_METNO|nr:2-oxo-4-hydroxy-4-carboxy-5-ureidoimidazoline decarboxylase [Methylobacterium nodulans]ACL60642.1 hydroxyisourate hydrolase [Methylobacterium nodulans ORS 2060]